MSDDLGTTTVKPVRTKIRVWIDFVCPYASWVPFRFRPNPVVYGGTCGARKQSFIRLPSALPTTMCPYAPPRRPIDETGPLFLLISHRAQPFFGPAAQYGPPWY